MDTSAADRLWRLMGRYDEANEQRANACLVERLATSASLMIFGAGQNGRLVLRLLREAGLEPAAFLDETRSKIGQIVDGTPVVGLEAAAAEVGTVVVCSIFSPGCDYLTIAARLRSRRLETISLFSFLRAFAAKDLPFYFLDSPAQVLGAQAEIAWLADRLIDRSSLDLLCAQIEFRLYLRHERLPSWTSHRQPAPGTWSRFALIDAGAFDGDTLLPMLANDAARVSMALALEPDPINFAKLELNIAAAGPVVMQKTRALRAAVDATSGCRAFAGLGNQGSGFSQVGDRVATVSIDDLVETHIPYEERLYIKFDVEGAEASALQGAARTLVEKAPFLAVSAYHRPHDLWTLPRLINGFDDRYRYRLVSHGADGADLMLYAFPPE